MLAQSAYAQRESDARIHAPAHEEEDFAPASVLADLLFKPGSAVLWVPVGYTAADTKHEVVQQLTSPRSMNHFGMELHGIKIPFRSRHSGDLAGGCAAENRKSLGNRGH